MEIVLGLLTLSPFHPLWLVMVIIGVTVFACIVSADCHRRAVKLVRVIKKR